MEKVEAELSSYSAKTAVIEQILRALSLRRQPEIEDSNFLKKWTQELSFDAENIIFAAKKLKKSSMEKLDEFLLELYAMKSFSKKEIAEYMDKKKDIYELAIKINKLGDFLVIQRLGLCVSIAGGTGSIPGWGTKILQTVQCRQNKNKN